MAQAAIESLRDHSPSVVSKSSRGECAVDDTGMQAWFAQEQDAGAWPPNENREELLARIARG